MENQKMRCSRRRRIKLWFTLCAVVFLVNCFGPVVLSASLQIGLNNASVSEDVDGLSLLEGVVINGEAQENGDCLVRIRESFDSVMINPETPNFDGAVISRELWIRWKFDYIQQRFLFASTTLEDRIEYGLVDKANGEPIRTGKYGRCEAWIFDALEKKYFKFRDGKISEQDIDLSKSADELLARLAPPDFRSIGITHTFRFKDFDKYSHYVEGIRARNDEFDVSRIGDKLNVRHYYSNIAKNGYMGYADYVFDLESHLPIKRISFRKNETSGKMIPITDEAEISWEYLDGVYLPSTLKTDGVGREIVRGDELEWGARQISLNFNWFSINGDKDAEFNPALIASEKKVRELLDPNKSSATSLLKVLENERIEFSSPKR